MIPAVAAKAYAKMSAPDFQPLANTAGMGGDFASMLTSTLKDISTTGAIADTTTLKAAAGQGNLVDVVTAVSQSELNIQTVVTLRDRVIEAYQQIMQMPI